MEKKIKILVTGPDGFVGTHLVKELRANQFEIIEASQKLMGDFTLETDFCRYLQGVDVVIHLAARVHIMNDQSLNPQAEYDFLNFEVTKHLAESALKSHVKQFIFLSTVKVNGEGRATPYNEADVAAPEDYYAISKWKAENALNEIFSKSETLLTIIRPPLIYGKGVKANFAALINATKKRVPLPFRSLQGKRSILYVGNLVDFINVVIQKKSAGTFLVADETAVTTHEILATISKVMGVRDLTFSVPEEFFRRALRLFGKEKIVDRLTHSLTVDIALAKEKVGWHPKYTMEEGLKETLAP